MIFLGGIFLGLGFGVLIFFGILRWESTPIVSELTQGSNSIHPPTLNAPAPNFELKDVSDEIHAFNEYRGKPVLLNFWATWCAPCRIEMPVFQNSFEEYDGDLSVIAINNAESKEDVQAFIDEFGLTFDFFLDPDSEIQHLYQINGYPTTFIIDSDGVIRVRHIGLISDDQLDRYLTEIGLP
jgi:thiol-disulfide isomerase/thioredoxin